jgi:hypothetical protein
MDISKFILFLEKYYSKDEISNLQKQTEMYAPNFYLKDIAYNFYRAKDSIDMFNPETECSPTHINDELIKCNQTKNGSISSVFLLPHAIRFKACGFFEDFEVSLPSTVHDLSRWKVEEYFYKILNRQSDIYAFSIDKKLRFLVEICNGQISHIIYYKKFKLTKNQKVMVNNWYNNNKKYLQTVITYCNYYDDVPHQKDMIMP